MATLFQNWKDGKEGFSNYGSFQTAILNAYMKADFENAEKLAAIFPNWFKEPASTMGTNLMGLIDGELALFEGNTKVYKDRIEFIEEIERRLSHGDWISLANGTTFTKTFTPTKKG